MLLGAISGKNFFTFSRSSKPIQIGILVPIDHKALEDIVAGFKKVVHEEFSTSVHFNVQNAQGDIKLQRNILELFAGQQVDMIVPIGTSATRMALSIIKKQPILSLAAMITEEERKQHYSHRMTGVLDEISSAKKLDFIRSILPGLHTFTLIYHGANEKNYQEIEALKSYSKKMNIQLQMLVVQNLPELKLVGAAISANSQAILILKDHMLASGIQLLIPIARDRHIPLITSDEGTVKEGATVALGVREQKLGELGGRIAVSILKGSAIEELPLQSVEELVVFYNSQACKQQHIDISILQEYANKHQYQLVDMEGLRVKNVQG